MARVKNFEIARLFYEIAALLEARQESRFRIRAYQRAAQTVESLSEDLAAVAARGGLQALPGIGRELAARIDEYLATGTMRHVETLRGELPAAFPTLLEVRGLGPRTARALYERLGIGTIEQLEDACRSGAILGVAGVREKTRDNILKGIAAWRAGRARTPLHAFLLNAWYFDWLYDRAIVRPYFALCAFLLRFDLGVIDGLVNLTGRIVQAWAAGSRRVQTGYVVNYALTMLAGAVALVGFLLAR